MAFLFYPEAFLSGTAGLSHEDRGKYITILCRMYLLGNMNEQDIITLTGPVSEPLRKKFTVDEKGFWHNIRLERETKKRARFIMSRRVNGCLGGRPKNSNSVRVESEKPLPHSHCLKEGAKQTSFDFLPVPQGPMQAIFTRWIEYRKSIRKPLKEQSLQGAFKRLKELSDNDPVKAETIVSFSIDNGYQGLFAPQENKYKQFKNLTEQWLA